MNELINGNAIKMTSIEIAELVGKRHDNVKRTIETLAKNGVIRLPQIEVSERINNLGFNVQYEHYVFEGEQGTQRSLLMLTRLSKVSVLMFLLGVSACKSPPPVQSQRPEPAAWAMEKAQDLQQMLNSIITVSEVESTG